MPIYGYARVSTLDQDLAIQRAALKAAGASVVRAEKASGSRRDGRTEMQVLLDFVQPGDGSVKNLGRYAASWIAGWPNRPSSTAALTSGLTHEIALVEQPLPKSVLRLLNDPCHYPQASAFRIYIYQEPQPRAAHALALGGDYALALKGNQGTLHDDVVRFLDDPAARAATSKPNVDAGHGRIETRTATVSADIGWLQEQHNWPGLAAIGKVRRIRETATGTTAETAHYLLSAALTPERLNEVARSHWGVENQLHWRLDVVMNEDQDRTRLGHGPENLAVLRHMALKTPLIFKSHRTFR